MTVDLAGRVAVVTGAGRGIGRAYALRLAAYGARVVVNDAGVATDGSATDEDPATAVVAEIAAGGGEAVTHRGDIADSTVADALVQRALDAFGGLDIVINNAGFGRPRMVFNLSDAEWDDVIRVHLRGTFVVSRPACRYWRAQAKANGETSGRLLNTASGLLVYGGAGQSNYVAAKAGVQAFTEAVATEMAPYGVTANTIMPGANTRLAAIGWRTPAAIEAAHAAGETWDRTDPVHVAEFGCYLASPAAGWISGQTFQARGGIVEHVGSWRVLESLERSDAGFRADDFAREFPRLFNGIDVGARRAELPPREWVEARKASTS